MTYGLPYKGSKNRLIDKLIELFPSKENFYDLFAGGFSVTHGALLSSKWKNIYANELDGGMCDLFKDAVAGKYKDEKRWISREDFFKLKDTDPYVALIWSFGNNKRDYLYSKEIEPYKKACYYALVFGDTSYAESIGVCLPDIKKCTDLESRKKALKHIDRFSEALQRLSRVQNLERLSRVQNLEITNKSYEQVLIKENSLVYCDIPYKNTNGYSRKNKKDNFNHEWFYNWCSKQTELVLVSSYELPKEDFTEVASFKLNSTMSSFSNGISVNEKIFVPNHQIDLWNKCRAKEELFDIQDYEKCKKVI